MQVGLNENSPRLRIGIQKKGRLTAQSLELLNSIGIVAGIPSKLLFTRCENGPVDIFFHRNEDIPKFLKHNKCDLAIVGQNIVAEYEAEHGFSTLEPVLKLPFGRCRLSLAFKQGQSIDSLEQIEGFTLATSYPNILKQELGKQGINVNIIELKGGVEIAPMLEICDGIFDIVSTGSTLKAHGLSESICLFRSDVYLYAAPRSDDLFIQQLEVLKMRLIASIKGMESKYLMMNAPVNRVDDILEVLPSMESPSILQLSTDATKVSIHGVVQGQDIWGTVESLKLKGASSILVAPIEKVVS
jgi:ATP phosphoribosyltransferase